MTQIDTEAAARALFEVTFNGTLQLLPTWEEQPQAFKQDFRRRATAVTLAALHEEASPYAGASVHSEG